MLLKRPFPSSSLPSESQKRARHSQLLASVWPAEYETNQKPESASATPAAPFVLPFLGAVDVSNFSMGQKYVLLTPSS